MHTDDGWKKKLTGLASILLLVFIILPMQAKALDSVVNLPTPVVPATAGGGSSGCSFYFIDTYDGTVMPGGTGSTSLAPSTTFALKFYNSLYNSAQSKSISTPTLQTPMVPCAGTYQLVFTIEIQATTNVATLVITPEIKDTLGTTLYPPAAGSATTTLYPQCNNGGYANTPYCTVGWVSGSVQVQLPVSDKVIAPTFTADSPVAVLGGQFELIYIPPR